jgi:hypothetical protein
MAAQGLIEISDRAVVRTAPRRLRIPAYAAAVLDALALRDASVTGLESLTEAQWKRALNFCDKAQLTLLLGHYRGHALPEWVAARIEGNARNHGLRLASTKAALFEITDALDAQQISYVLLKGLTHSPEFTPDPLIRAQGDCDLWFQPDDVLAARDVLTGLGYAPVCGGGRRHLAPMARPSDWEWDGDYFSPGVPLAVDLHYQLWDEDGECFPAPGEDAFWKRRRSRMIDERPIRALSTADTLAFAAMHFIMHLLQGEARLQRAWEIANFLNNHAADHRFWLSWHSDHQPALRRIEALVFMLVSQWFRCELHPLLQAEFDDLGGEIRLWMRRYAFAPIEALFEPNKHELWLHLALIGDHRKRVKTLMRRVVPLRLPSSLKPVGPKSESGEGSRERAVQISKQPISKHKLKYAAGRLLFHCRVLLPTLVSGARWLWLRRELGYFTRN